MNQQCFDTDAFYRWSKILFELEAQWGEATVAAWFDGVQLLEFTEERLSFAVANAFQYEVISRRCLNRIRTALKRKFHSDAAVEVILLDTIQ